MIGLDLEHLLVHLDRLIKFALPVITKGLFKKKVCLVGRNGLVFYLGRLPGHFFFYKA